MKLKRSTIIPHEDILVPRWTFLLILLSQKNDLYVPNVLVTVRLEHRWQSNPPALLIHHCQQMLAPHQHITARACLILLQPTPSRLLAQRRPLDHTQPSAVPRLTPTSRQLQCHLIPLLTKLIASRRLLCTKLQLCQLRHLWTPRSLLHPCGPRLRSISSQHTSYRSFRPTIFQPQTLYRRLKRHGAGLARQVRNRGRGSTRRK
jgi:hypothetical protein